MCLQRENPYSEHPIISRPLFMDILLSSTLLLLPANLGILQYSFLPCYLIIQGHTALFHLTSPPSQSWGPTVQYFVYRTKKYKDFLTNFIFFSLSSFAVILIFLHFLYLILYFVVQKKKKNNWFCLPMCIRTDLDIN